MTNHNAELPTENQTPTAQSGTSDRAIAEVVRKMAATGWEANSYSTCYEGKRILVAAAEIDNIEPPAGARDAVAWPARFGCNGPEGSFWTDDSALANKLIAATYDRDEWTVTDTTNPTGISSKLVVDTQPAAPGAVEGVVLTHEQEADVVRASNEQLRDEREQALQDYLSDYEFYGEDEAGREGTYTPNERELILIEDAIRGWDARED